MEYLFYHDRGNSGVPQKHEKLVECAAVAKLPTKYGEFKAYGYQNILNGEHHVALVKVRSETERMCCAVYTPSA